MGFINDDVRRARDRALENERREMDQKNRRSIAAFCASDNIRRIVAKVRDEVASAYHSADEVSRVVLMYEDVDVFVAKSDHCAQVLLNALRAVEPATSVVELEAETYSSSRRINVFFNPPLK